MTKKERGQWLIGLKYALGILLGWLLAHTLYISTDGLRDSRQPADLAVVLGNKVNEDGTLSERLAQRLACGLRLYRRGQVRGLLVSGGLGKEGYYEGDKMRDYLLAHGVPAAAIVVDNNGNDTRQTVANTLRLQGRLHFKSLVVVSQYFHITRTKMLFRQAGFSRVGGASPAYFELRDGYSLLREFGAYYKERFFDRPKPPAPATQ